VLAKADRASMQASLELRTPYLHRELVELAATIPPRTHLEGGGKVILRRVLKRVLPDSAHTRAKVAFRAPSGEWLRGALSPILREHLRGSRLYEDGWFDRRAVTHLADEHDSGTDRSKVLWPIFVLGTWLDAR
jgi:asparagine synthase (glutamine-hydrolysing)